tara:strand:+ start:65 stop:568 length:504 start_codon:yes stop_codon:yes gene_type:complete
MNSSSEDEDIEKKGVCCSNCGKKFSYHQGLYTHRKSGVCKKMVKDMINVKTYIDNLVINIDEYKCFLTFEEILNKIFENNDFDKLPFRITDRKRKSIRVLDEDDKYMKDHSYTQFNLFISKIRMLLIRKLDMSGILKGNDSVIEFLSILTRDVSIPKVINLIDNATC